MAPTNEFLVSLVATIVYFIGVYLHGRIIQVSRKEKFVTWKLDVTNSIVLIAHYMHKLLMYGITYVIADLYTYTGGWFCYASKVLAYYGNLYTAGHSAIVSILKYVIIVYWRKARDFGNDNVKNIFFVLNFLHPALTILLHLIIVPDFFWAYDSFQHFDRCLGDPKGNWVLQTNRSQTKLHSLCHFDAPLDENYIQYTIYILRSSVCWIQFCTLYAISWNLFEIFFYCRIFIFMHG